MEFATWMKNSEIPVTSRNAPNKINSTIYEAILPAFLYFLGIFIMVHLEAKRLGLKGLNKEELPKFGHLILTKGFLLLPLIILVVMVMKFISGIVTEPVVTVFATELPDTMPHRALEITATLAGPPEDAAGLWAFPSCAWPHVL